ncbi:glucoside xylosyltransferase 1-like [Macrobrachium rosenbergii]|uniref:glucoside xylosyltransferase 1-like n=1 Tax=Macrobrachium rosenbergii TaxID=79674 RepID=UPI0034D78383
MIMNMTRLRALPTGWSNLVQEIYNRKKRRIGKVIVDGIINYLLAKNVELYYDLNCTWNYNTGTCVNELNSCMQAEETGIYLLSGIHSRYGGSKYYTKFHAVFEAWLRHRVGSGLSGLLKDITRRIRRDKPSEFWCNELSTMEYMLTKSLAVLAD